MASEAAAKPYSKIMTFLLLDLNHEKNLKLIIPRIIPAPVEAIALIEVAKGLVAIQKLTWLGQLILLPTKMDIKIASKEKWTTTTPKYTKLTKWLLFSTSSTLLILLAYTKRINAPIP
jgi:hypothetical protein